MYAVNARANILTLLLRSSYLGLQRRCILVNPLKLSKMTIEDFHDLL
jgi:hypothetical protein